jgi:hypothetical protein
MSTSTSTNDNDNDNDNNNDNKNNNNNDNDNDNENDNDNDNALHQLSNYHPIFIEGMGYYDPRDPIIVAQNVYKSLQSHFNATAATTASGQYDGTDADADAVTNQRKQPQQRNSNKKPYIVIVQGDPLHTNGISAITRIVANLLNCSRGLICLDDDIDPTHAKNADRDNVILELKYSQLVQNLLFIGNGNGNGNGNDDGNDDVDVDVEEDNNNNNNTMKQIEYSIDELIQQKNHERIQQNKQPMKDYFKQYALLQEVTKASIRKICNNNQNQNQNENENNPITIVHTSKNINPYSVTSFYTVGIKLGLINETTDMVSYYCENENDEDEDEILDFNVIDKR